MDRVVARMIETPSLERMQVGMPVVHIFHPDLLVLQVLDVLADLRTGKKNSHQITSTDTTTNTT
jgi:hypothetical protein